MSAKTDWEVKVREPTNTVVMEIGRSHPSKGGKKSVKVTSKLTDSLFNDKRENWSPEK